LRSCPTFFLTLVVFLDSDLSTIKVGDWGFAALYEPGKFLDTSCGSLDYASPEILTGKSFGPEVDVWSLGTSLIFQSPTALSTSGYSGAFPSFAPVSLLLIPHRSTFVFYGVWLAPFPSLKRF
jgi:serine/threonine protein kinase